MGFKIGQGRHHGLLPCIARIVERGVVHQIAERLATLVVVGGEAFRDEATGVHRFNIVLAEPFGPIGAHGEQTGHEHTRHETQRHHGLALVVDEQAEFVEGPVLEHLRVRSAFHAPAKKMGYLNRRLGTPLFVRSRCVDAHR